MPKQRAKNAKRKATAREFQAAISRAAREFPEFAGRYAITSVEKSPAASAEKLQCVKWGRDPVTGHRVCLKWGPAS